MEHSILYYYGLCVLDALDHETRRTMARHGTDGQRKILRRWAYRCMDPQEHTCDLFMMRFKGLIDGYFGPGEAQAAWDCVSTFYQVANTHVRERMTDGPYTIQPIEFEYIRTIEEGSMNE